jgi:hypothetical protein
MPEQVVARFLVDHPVRPGMVRAILETLSAQGGAYEPQLVRRSPDEGLRRIAESRPAGLLDDVGREGTETTFMRVAEGRPEPVLSFLMSEAPRAVPSKVTMTVPASTVETGRDVEQVLGVCKGLYLFLESPWAVVGTPPRAGGQASPPQKRAPGDSSHREPGRIVVVHGRSRGAGYAPAAFLHWANFFGPRIVAHVGPSRLLTSMAFIVEILPDGGVMLVTHASPRIAAAPEGRRLCEHIEETTGIGRVLAATPGREMLFGALSSDRIRVRRRPIPPAGSE